MRGDEKVIVGVKIVKTGMRTHLDLSEIKRLPKVGEGLIMKGLGEFRVITVVTSDTPERGPNGENIFISLIVE